MRKPQIYCLMEWSAPWAPLWQKLMSSIGAKFVNWPKNTNLSAAANALTEWAIRVKRPGDVLLVNAMDEVLAYLPTAGVVNILKDLHVFMHWHSYSDVPWNPDSQLDPDICGTLDTIIDNVDVWFTSNHPYVSTMVDAGVSIGFPVPRLTVEATIPWNERGYNITVAGRPSMEKQMPLAVQMAHEIRTQLAQTKANTSSGMINVCIPPVNRDDLATEQMLNALCNFSDINIVQTRSGYYRALRESRFYVSASLTENFPITPIEAMHSGCVPLLPDIYPICRLYPDQFMYAPYSIPHIVAKAQMWSRYETEWVLPFAVKSYSNPDIVRSRLMALIQARLDGATLYEARKNADKAAWDVNANSFVNQYMMRPNDDDEKARSSDESE